ncbi:MAG: hypothetical protein JNL70_12945 [Saprospiraceae bacterium]|nr:hypothetical protein [Saprospiraceae bacterium]
MKKALFLYALLLCGFVMTAQTTTQKNDEKIKIYLDCTRPWLCDVDFLKNEFKMVDYVRDRFTSDVHVILNTQFSGGGGEQNELVCKGLGRFAHKSDTLRYFNDATMTDDDKRQRLLKYLKLGLIGYVAQSSIADKIQFTYNDDKKDIKTEEKKKDPWNYWQFSVNTSGFFNGNKNYQSSDINAGVTADRETEKSRFRFRGDNLVSRQVISVDKEKVEINRDQQSIFANYVQKMNEHWAFGIGGDFTRSIFDNIDARIGVSPRVEYSVKPYKKFNNERIVFQYEIGPQFSNYRDTTIYFKTQEVLIQQKAAAICSFTKPWGSINVGAFWSNYMDDFSKNNLGIGGGISWRIFKGFQFAVGGNFQFVHDQISLPLEGASRDDVLTRRRLIATTYDYWAGVGFSYRFGSIYNSQVHPSFKGLSYSLNF